MLKEEGETEENESVEEEKRREMQRKERKPRLNPEELERATLEEDFGKQRQNCKSGMNLTEKIRKSK